MRKKWIFIYKLIATGSVKEAIVAMQAHTTALRVILDGRDNILSRLFHQRSGYPAPCPWPNLISAESQPLICAGAKTATPDEQGHCHVDESDAVSGWIVTVWFPEVLPNRGAMPPVADAGPVARRIHLSVAPGFSKRPLPARDEITVEILTIQSAKQRYGRDGSGQHQASLAAVIAGHLLGVPCQRRWN